MDQSDFVEVIDLTFLLAVSGKDGGPATVRYTVRPEAGDVLNEQPGVLIIQFAARDVKAGGETRRVAGKRVKMAGEQLVGMEQETRLEPRVRPSLKLVADRDAAEVDALKKKFGVQ